jgi:hypothetical protein
VLGGLLLGAAFLPVAAIVQADDFELSAHRLIFAAIASLAADSKVDPVTVAQRLEERGHLQAADGLAYLSELARNTPNAENVLAYARIVRDHAVRQRLQVLLEEPAASDEFRERLEHELARLKSDTPKSENERAYILLPAGEFLAPGKPPVFIVDKLFEEHAVIGIVAPTESGKSLLIQNVAACLATGKPFHGRKVKRGLVVYLVGEGQHGLRKRFQALESRYQLGLADAPLVIARTAASFLDAAEVARVGDAIAAAQDRYGLPLLFLAVDTLARFIAPGDESKAQDMGAYLNALDLLRGDAAAATLHHPGHGDTPRARGSSSWRAGIDAEFWLENAEKVVTVTCQKMKDGEKPAPFSFRIETEPTRMAREDGSPVQSVVLVPTDAQAAKPTGKNQKRLLAELEQRAASDQVSIWTEGELREIARSIGMHKNSARDAVLGLRQLGYFVATVGGSRLKDPPEGPKDRKRTERPISSPDAGDRKDPVSLETDLSSRLSSPPPVDPNQREDGPDGDVGEVF